jgi:inner membrane protein
MLIAHGPAGYLLTKLISPFLLKNYKEQSEKDRVYNYLLAAGIIGGIAPDFDFIYHIFIDSTRTPHHSYITHMPIFWIGLCLLFSGLGKFFKNTTITAVAITFCAAAMLHLTLDTFTGVIYWLYPISGQGFNIVKVADVHLGWVQNFTHHWTFIFEIAIFMFAMAVYLRVKETIRDIVNAYRKYQKLREITKRLIICLTGILIILFAGSLKFSLDNKVFSKALQFKRIVAEMLN